MTRAAQQVNAAINQMDQSTQQNATMVEESNAASHSQSQEMTQLASLIDQFQVGVPRDETALRRELVKVAPHAFAKPAPAASGKPARAAPRATKPETGAAEPARRAKVANAGTAADDGWSDFWNG